MRDALGGIVNIQLILVFIVLVSGYLAFSVNYTKAFRVKNKIISVIEQYEGDIDKGYSDIKEYVDSVGYTTSTNSLRALARDFGISERDCKFDLGFCYKENIISNSPTLARKQYKVWTVIYIDIPLINQVLPNTNLFRVSGDTKTIIVHK